MERTIRVKGYGKINVRPDLTIIKLEFSINYPCYEAALFKSIEDINNVKETIVKAGINEGDIKTTDFGISENYDENRPYETSFGVKHRYSLEFSFDIDYTLLNKVLYEITKIELETHIHISFGVKNVELMKSELITQAIIDAKKKADVIARTAGVGLQEILDIDYSQNDYCFASDPIILTEREININHDIEHNTYAFNIIPSDIEISESILVVYKIS